MSLFLGVEVYEEWSLPGLFIDCNRSEATKASEGARFGPSLLDYSAVLTDMEREGWISPVQEKNFPHSVLEVEVSGVERSTCILRKEGSKLPSPTGFRAKMQFCAA